MDDNNEIQWWKKYVPEPKFESTESTKTQWEEIEHAPWKIDFNSIDDYQGFYDRLACSRYFDFSNAPASVLNDILKLTGNVSGGSRQGEWHREHLVGEVSRNPKLLECNFELLKQTALEVGGLDNIILTHKNCTEKDLIELAKTSASLEWKTVDKTKEGLGHRPIVGELTMWGKIFMDPQASRELRQAIAEHSLIDNRGIEYYFDFEDRIRYRAEGIENEPTVLDYYLKRNDCPKEFFLPAVKDAVWADFNKYYRNINYYVDAERLNEIVAHPNMTAEAFEEALYIVREDMVEYAEDPEEVDGPYYRGKDDTCDLTWQDKQQILQTMLRNPACTPEIAVDIFEAAKKTDLLEEQREARWASAKRQKEIDNAIARVHQKSLDLFTVKKAGDVELNKAVMREKFVEGDVLQKKEAGNTKRNKRIMQLYKRLTSRNE